MKAAKFLSNSNVWKIILAGEISKHINPGDIVCLFGDLGAGKTTFTKGLAQGLGIDPKKVGSPTFVLMAEYRGKLKKSRKPVSLFHFDLYRLDTIEEISLIGYDEFLYSEGISVIEWADRLKELMPKEYVRVTLTHKGDDKRWISITAIGARHKNFMKKIVGINVWTSYPWTPQPKSSALL